MLDRGAGNVRGFVEGPHDNNAALPIQECGRECRCGANRFSANVDVLRDFPIPSARPAPARQDHTSLFLNPVPNDERQVVHDAKGDNTVVIAFFTASRVSGCEKRTTSAHDAIAVNFSHIPLLRCLRECMRELQSALSDYS